MSGKIITVSSGKGGVGKTTTAANLSISLAMQGHRVACIDADIGLRNLDVMLGLENRIVYDIVHYIEGRCRLRQALVRDKRFPELFLMPAAQTRDKESISVEDMTRVARDTAELVEFVLIDSPAGIEHGFRYAVAPADLVLIVTNAEVTAVRDADRVIGLLEAEALAPAKLIINRFKPELVRRNDMREGFLYFQVTRGVAERDFVFPDDARPTVAMFTQAKPIVDSPAASKGIAVVTVPDLRWARRDDGHRHGPLGAAGEGADLPGADCLSGEDSV